MATSFDKVYYERLEAGLQYQDFLCRELHKAGIVLQPIYSKTAQRTGENLLGAEIKYDKRMKETRNVFIETAEKRDPSRASWTASGIMREDNSWLYIIGDYERAYIFAKNVLKFWVAKHRPEILTNDTQTSQGFLIGRAVVEGIGLKTPLASKVVVFGNSDAARKPKASELSCDAEL